MALPTPRYLYTVDITKSPIFKSPGWRHFADWPSRWVHYAKRIGPDPINDVRVFTRATKKIITAQGADCQLCKKRYLPFWTTPEIFDAWIERAPKVLDWNRPAPNMEYELIWWPAERVCLDCFRRYFPKPDGGLGRLWNF